MKIRKNLAVLFALASFCGSLSASDIHDLSSFKANHLVSPKQDAMKNTIDNVTHNVDVTSVVLHNKGGYLAKLGVEYFISNKDGTHRIHKVTELLSFGGVSHPIKIPAEAFNTRVTAELATGLIWQQSRVIFNEPLCPFNNQWSDGNENRVQDDIWGTTFNSPWSMVKPQDTYANGSPTGYKCGEI